MMEPIGSLMISQYQACKPNNSDVQKDYSSANINHFIEQETIKKMNAVTNVSKSTFDKSNENNDFNSKSKKEFLEKDKKRIKENIDRINKQIRNTSIRFIVHEESNRIEIKVIDEDTDKVIREIPPEKMLDAYAERMEFLGLNFDAKR